MCPTRTVDNEKRKKQEEKKYTLLMTFNISLLIKYMIRTELSFVQKMLVIFIKKLYMVPL